MNQDTLIMRLHILIYGLAFVLLVNLFSPASVNALPTPDFDPWDVSFRRAGYLDNVTVFYNLSVDNVYDQGGDFDFIVDGGRVIQPFNDAVKGLFVDENITIFIPADENPYNDRDPPHSLQGTNLTFFIILLEITYDYSLYPENGMDTVWLSYPIVPDDIRAGDNFTLEWQVNNTAKLWWNATVDNVLVAEDWWNNITISVTFSNLSKGNHDIKLHVYDELKNHSESYNTIFVKAALTTATSATSETSAEETTPGFAFLSIGAIVAFSLYQKKRK